MKIRTWRLVNPLVELQLLWECVYAERMTRINFSDIYH